MQITLDQIEIEHAIEAYVRSQITIDASQEIGIDFVNGRAPNGLTATLKITPAKIKASKPVFRGGPEQTTARAIRAVKADPQPEPEQSEEEPETAQAEDDDVDVLPPTDDGPEEASAVEEQPQEEEEAKPAKASPFSKLKAAAEAPEAEESTEAERPKSIFSKR